MKHTIFLSIILLLFLLPVALSLNVYIRPPRIVARMNVTSTYDGFLEVKNQNNYTVNVTLQPQGDLVGKVKLSESLVILQPDELRTINFTINVKQPGTYQGVVLVTYLAKDQPGVGLQAEIIVIANEVESSQKTTGFVVLNNTLKYAIIGFIVLITLILVLLFFLSQ